jgi:hypothetical protein
VPASRDTIGTDATAIVLKRFSAAIRIQHVLGLHEHRGHRPPIGRHVDEPDRLRRAVQLPNGPSRRGIDGGEDFVSAAGDDRRAVGREGYSKGHHQQVAVLGNELTRPRRGRS